MIRPFDPELVRDAVELVSVHVDLASGRGDESSHPRRLDSDAPKPDGWRTRHLSCKSYGFKAFETILAVPTVPKNTNPLASDHT